MSETFFISSNKDFLLHQGDCLEVLGTIEDCSIDTIFADPPYFLSNGGISCQNGRMVCVDKGDWDKGGTPEHIEVFNTLWLSACKSKLKDNGTIWISGTFHNIFSVALCLTKLGYKILNVVTWQKNNPAPNLSCRFFTHSTELVIWARKSEKTSHLFNYDLMKDFNGGKQMTDVWKLPTTAKWEKTCGKHPTQKPLSLLYRIILASTPEGGTVLDPFCGSGTTGIAANLLKRKFIGIDISEEYLNLSKERRLELEDPDIIRDYLHRICSIKTQ